MVPASRQFNENRLLLLIADLCMLESYAINRPVHNYRQVLTEVT